MPTTWVGIFVNTGTALNHLIIISIAFLVLHQVITPAVITFFINERPETRLIILFLLLINQVYSQHDSSTNNVTPARIAGKYIKARLLQNVRYEKLCPILTTCTAIFYRMQE